MDNKRSNLKNLIISTLVLVISYGYFFFKLPEYIASHEDRRKLIYTAMPIIATIIFIAFILLIYNAAKLLSDKHKAFSFAIVLIGVVAILYSLKESMFVLFLMTPLFSAPAALTVFIFSPEMEDLIFSPAVIIPSAIGYAAVYILGYFRGKKEA